MVWLTTNGPKIGDAVDTFTEEASPLAEDIRQGLNEIMQAVKGGEDITIKTTGI